MRARARDFAVRTATSLGKSAGSAPIRCWPATREDGTLAAMGDVINLARARKRKAAEQRAAQADANAVRHGRTRAERDEADARERLASERLDGAKRERDDEG